METAILLMNEGFSPHTRSSSGIAVWTREKNHFFDTFYPIFGFFEVPGTPSSSVAPEKDQEKAVATPSTVQNDAKAAVQPEKKEETKVEATKDLQKTSVGRDK